MNLYMFHGGTNFGFMNGANVNSGDLYQPTITSYDYDAPLSEHGAVTEKFVAIKSLLAELPETGSPCVLLLALLFSLLLFLVCFVASLLRCLCL